MPTRNFDVVILGGGNAGMGVTVATREVGLSVAMIEPHLLGGTCPNRGCIPKKVLVAAAHALDEIERAKTHHVTVGKPTLDWPALIERQPRRALQRQTPRWRGMAANLRSPSEAHLWLDRRGSASPRSGVPRRSRVREGPSVCRLTGGGRRIRTCMGLFLSSVEPSELGRPRQAARMGGQNPLVAPPHRFLRSDPC